MVGFNENTEYTVTQKGEQHVLSLLLGPISPEH